ncbi:MAG: helix-turn-helix domain-containing protein [Rhodospirillales bacterium]|nr:helix-turn-helix domain-containing protein [Rhodospirillales bacterium]
MDNAEEQRDDPLGSLLAARIRRERDARGWSIAELAAASGVSRAMISRIERTEASPTAALLGKLSGAFGLTVSQLMARAEADSTPTRLVRGQERETWTDPETAYIRHALTPPGADPEMVLIELPPGKSVSYPASSYTVMRGQSVWVMSGTLTIREGGDDTTLHTGDCLAFDMSELKDRAYINPSETETAKYVVSLARR